MLRHFSWMAVSPDSAPGPGAEERLLLGPPRMRSSAWTPAALCRATVFLHLISAALARRHAVYWNSSNTRLTSGDLSIQVKLNDYLDIYCPHYPSEGALGPGPPETVALYLIGEAAFKGCVETRGAIKRWECNTPHAPFGPVRFSEKIQRFTPFSLGFEFLPGHHYYYSSLPTDEGPPLPCMKLRVTVALEPISEGSKQIQVTVSLAPRRAAPAPFLTVLVLLLSVT